MDEVEDEFTEISLEDALEIDPRYQVGRRGGIPGHAERISVRYRGTDCQAGGCAEDHERLSAA